uniref:RelA/SpoT domain-containing protein n=1 Tax=Hemiselmis andersenii TaxID=464988 RepID=A0A6U2FDA2_HEMAN
MAALGISDFLDRRFESVLSTRDHRFEATSLGGIVFSTMPISSALTRRPFQLFLLASAAALLVAGVRGALLFRDSTGGLAFGPYEHYRFTTILTRNRTHGPLVTTPGLSEFGVLGRDSCPPDGSIGPDRTIPPPVMEFAGASVVATYPGGIGMNGWYIHTATREGTEGMDPAYFIVTGTNDAFDLGDGSCALPQHSRGGRWWEGTLEAETEWCGAKWRLVGAPQWRYNTQGVLWDFLRVPVELSKARGKEGLESFWLKPPWYHFHLYWVIPNIAVGLGFTISVLVALLSSFQSTNKSKYLLPPPHFVLTFFLSITAFSVTLHAILTASDSAWTLAYESAATGFALWFIPPIGLVQGYSGPFRGIVLVLLGTYALLENAFWAALCFYYWQDPAARFSAGGLLGLILFLMTLVVRMAAVWSSHKMLKADQRVYDAVWQSMWGNEESRAKMIDISNTVKYSFRDAPNQCRQFNRLQLGLNASEAPADLPHGTRPEIASDMPIHPLFTDLRHFTLPNTRDFRSPITSCNQLFCQAAIVNLLFRDRLKEWADASYGLFREIRDADAEQERPLVKWRAVKNDPKKASRVYFTPMKRHRRCLEKLLRSYSNDPSRLLDIARGCIVFETFDHLHLCIKTIAADDNVVVERIKNRMSPDYDSARTAGYRDVCINLRIVNRPAQALGVELHACELQLLHRDYAALNSDDGHMRYMQARNASGT